MKRTTSPKLALHRETVLHLDSGKLTWIIGGITANTVCCPTAYRQCGTETSDHCNTSGGCP